MSEKHPQPPQPPQYHDGRAPTTINVVSPQGQGQGQYDNPNAAFVGQQYRDNLFARCAQGQHERKTEYGVCGIITAVALFPFGLICLFMDTNVKCARCGISLQK